MMMESACGYFLEMRGLSKDAVGSPVMLPNSDQEIGRINYYNEKTGFARIRLYCDVPARDLISSGVPFEHIVFRGEA